MRCRNSAFIDHSFYQAIGCSAMGLLALLKPGLSDFPRIINRKLGQLSCSGARRGTLWTHERGRYGPAADTDPPPPAPPGPRAWGAAGFLARAIIWRAFDWAGPLRLAAPFRLAAYDTDRDSGPYVHPFPAGWHAVALPSPISRPPNIARLFRNRLPDLRTHIALSKPAGGGDGR